MKAIELSFLVSKEDKNADAIVGLVESDLGKKPFSCHRLSRDSSIPFCVVRLRTIPWGLINCESTRPKFVYSSLINVTSNDLQYLPREDLNSAH